MCFAVRRGDPPRYARVRMRGCARAPHIRCGEFCVCSQPLNGSRQLKIEKHWLVLVAMALGAASGAAMSWRSRARRMRSAHALDVKSQLKSWENEGGNLAPAPATAAMRP